MLHRYLALDTPWMHTLMKHLLMKHTLLALTLSLFAAQAAMAITPPSAEQLEASARAFELVPGVLADPDRQWVFLMNPEGGIDAVNAISGALLWSDAAAAKPLALYGDLLVAQTGSSARLEALEIALLDFQTGDRRATLNMELPPGVSGFVAGRLGKTFAARAGTRDGELVVSWEHTERWSKGIAPPPGTAIEQKLVGGYRLDLAAESAAVLTEVEVAETAEPGLPATVRQAYDSGALRIQPMRTGEIIASTTSTSLQGQNRLVLKRWNADTGEALPEVELVRGAVIVQFPSADSRHLLVSQRVAPGEWDEYAWTIFSIETGQRLGTLRNHHSQAWFFVQDETFVFESRPYGRRDGQEWVEEPRKLQGIELATGARVWQRPLRDLAYKGPLPP